MFSSLASFLFGSTTSGTLTTEHNRNPDKRQEQADEEKAAAARFEEAENTIEVTSSTPSVTGSTARNTSSTTNFIVASSTNNKRGRSKRNKNKRQGSGNRNAVDAGPNNPRSSITKLLLTPNDSFDEDIDDEDWFIVDHEEEGDEDSLPRTDSEEEVSIVKSQLGTPSSTTTITTTSSSSSSSTSSGNGSIVNVQRRRLNINSHSLYSGPRPQQQRNYLQRSRNFNNRTNGSSTISLNPSKSISNNSATISSPNGLSDGGMTQSLYVASSSNHGQGQQQQHNNNNNNDNFNGAINSMEESWYITPPPCFTSVGPVNMETSPFENLLIEHPSMSVYHSIRCAQEAAESFINLDLGEKESQQRNATNTTTTTAVVATANNRPQSVQQRSGNGPRIDRQNAAEIKQELLERSNQKNREKKERQKLCASAMKRSNAAREFQSKGNRPRRADLQHYKVNSGANNNRNTHRFVRKTFA